MPARLARQPHRVIAEARWRGSRCGGAVTHLSTTRSATAAAAPECSPWSPARPSCGFRSPFTWLLSCWPSGPPLSSQTLLFLGCWDTTHTPILCSMPLPIVLPYLSKSPGTPPMLFLALLYPQAITTSGSECYLSTNKIIPKIQ